MHWQTTSQKRLPLRTPMPNSRFADDPPRLAAPHVLNPSNNPYEVSAQIFQRFALYDHSMLYNRIFFAEIYFTSTLLSIRLIVFSKAAGSGIVMPLDKYRVHFGYSSLEL